MNFQFSYFGLLFNRCPPFPEPIQEEKIGNFQYSPYLGNSWKTWYRRLGTTDEVLNFISSHH